MDEIEELNDTFRGKYIVTTQGSTHLWDLDEMTVTRRPGSESAGIGFLPEDNFVARGLAYVNWWPQVDSCFHVGYIDGGWHRSSTIKSIERVR